MQKVVKTWSKSFQLEKSLRVPILPDDLFSYVPGCFRPADLPSPSIVAGSRFTYR